MTIAFEIMKRCGKLFWIHSGKYATRIEILWFGFTFLTSPLEMVLERYMNMKKALESLAHGDTVTVEANGDDLEIEIAPKESIDDQPAN